MKLYYYKKTKTFHCYTECGQTFTIFDLFIKYYEIRNIEYNWYNDIFDIIENKVGMIHFDFEAQYQSKKEKYSLSNRIIELPEYNKSVLDCFKKYYCVEWLEEGILPTALEKYNILYSISQNAIVIPHYDINNRLIGIRKRALNTEDIAKGKYKPIIVENKIYSHPLSLNLYGLNSNLSAINHSKKVILFEAEKSILKMEGFYKDNISVATCGNNFNKMQLNLLLYKTKIEEIIIAFDKDYQNLNSVEAQKCFEKWFNICKKYNKYYNFSFIYDKTNLLGYKDAPIDKGKEVFEKLLSQRIFVN